MTKATIRAQGPLPGSPTEEPVPRGSPPCTGNEDAATHAIKACRNRARWICGDKPEGIPQQGCLRPLCDTCYCYCYSRDPA